MFGWLMNYMSLTWGIFQNPHCSAHRVQLSSFYYLITASICRSLSSRYRIELKLSALFFVKKWNNLQTSVFPRNPTHPRNLHEYHISSTQYNKNNESQMSVTQIAHKIAKEQTFVYHIGTNTMSTVAIGTWRAAVCLRTAIGSTDWWL